MDADVSGVIEKPELQRFELPVEDSVAVVYYRLDGDRLVLTHTEVPQQYSGQGIGSRLAKGVFDILRKTGRKAVVKCPFLTAWLARHRDYNDVVVG
jgi:predicted GNAT family acetyltransferase